MNSRQAVVVLVAMVVFGLLTAVGARWARGEEQEKKSPIILHFWRTNGDTAEMVDLTIPKVGEECPDGFTSTDDPDYCGRDITVWVSLYYGGEQLNREQMRLRYRRSKSGYIEPHVMVFPGLRELEVESFYDANGLHHRVVGRMSVQFDHETDTWRVQRRETEDKFFAETERGLPFIRMLECVTGENRHAALD